jgi:hypothetical protein
LKTLPTLNGWSSLQYSLLSSFIVDGNSRF